MIIGLKKNSNDNFDISVGSLNSAEAFGLAEVFILYNLSPHDCIDTDSIGSYRDDGLLIVNY